jgi:hypothetical protein
MTTVTFTHTLQRHVPRPAVEVHGSSVREALDEDGADIEARTEGVGPHPLFNGVSWVEVVLSVRPTAESARNHLVIRGPGFSADFTNATYSVSGWQYLVRLNGPSGGK